VVVVATLRFVAVKLFLLFPVRSLFCRYLFLEDGVGRLFRPRGESVDGRVPGSMLVNTYVRTYG